MANGNGKKKKKRLIIISVVAVAVVALVIVAVAATRGGTKIDPTKLAKVEKGDLAKSVVATGKVTPITQGRNQIESQRHRRRSCMWMRATA